MIKSLENYWTVTYPANISDVCSINEIDVEYTWDSRQFLIDFVDSTKAIEVSRYNEGLHYCYGYSSFIGLEFMMNNGILP